MTTKPCRNCGSSDLYTKKNVIGSIVLWVPTWGRPKFEMLVCDNCGLIEWFVPARLLPKIKKKWEKV